MKTKNLQKILLVLILAISVVACGKNGEPGMSFSDANMSMEEDWAPMEEGGEAEAKLATEDLVGGNQQSVRKDEVQNGLSEVQRKIIYTGNLRMQVESIETTHRNVLGMLDKYGAYVSADNIDNSYGWQENTMTIRVPKENFYDMLAAVEKEAVFIDSKNVSASDVSEEYYDLKTRIGNKKAAEAQYLEVLKKAKTIAEILEVQSYLNNVREEIERMEGRIKYLDSQTSYSTLTVTFWQDKEVEPRKTPSFWDKAGKGFGHGWEGLMGFLVGVITLWPLWLIGIGIFFLIRWIVRRAKEKKTPPPAPKA